MRQWMALKRKGEPTKKVISKCETAIARYKEYEAKIKAEMRDLRKQARLGP
jgi:hypothetical protein